MYTHRSSGSVSVRQKDTCVYIVTQISLTYSSLLMASTSKNFYALQFLSGRKGGLFWGRQRKLWRPWVSEAEEGSFEAGGRSWEAEGVVWLSVGGCSFFLFGLSSHLSGWLSGFCVCVVVCLCIRLVACLPVCLSVYLVLFSVCLALCTSVCLHLCLVVRRALCLSGCQSVCLHQCLVLCLFGRQSSSVSILLFVLVSMRLVCPSISQSVGSFMMASLYLGVDCSP